MERQKQLELIKKWLKVLWREDKNNCIFDTYNEYLENNGKQKIEENKENLNIILNDICYIEKVLERELEIEMFEEEVVEFLEIYGEL